MKTFKANSILHLFFGCIIILSSCTYSTQQTSQNLPSTPLELVKRPVDRKISIYSSLESVDSPYTIIKTIFVPSGQQEIAQLKKEGIRIGADAIILNGSSNDVRVTSYQRTPSLLEHIIYSSANGNHTINSNRNSVVEVSNNSYAKAIAVIYKHNLDFVKDIQKDETLYLASNDKTLYTVPYLNLKVQQQPNTVYENLLYFSSPRFTMQNRNQYWQQKNKKNGILRTYKPPQATYWFEFKSKYDELGRIGKVTARHPIYPIYKFTKIDTHTYHYFENSRKIAYRILELNDLGYLKEVWNYNGDKFVGKDYFNEDGQKIYYSKVQYFSPEDFE